MDNDKINCRVCGSDERRYLCSTHNSQSATAEIRHYRCLNCGSVFVGNDISNEELGVAYGSLDEPTYYDAIESTNVIKLQSIAETFKSKFPATARIIDIGCGDGTFIRILKEAGFTDVWGQEIPGHGEAAREYANGVYEDYDQSTIPPQHFDVVTMIDVMEHVPSPLDTLRRTNAVLRPGGTLYFHSPRVSMLDRAMHALGGRVLPIWQNSRTSVFHLQNYSDQGINKMLKTAGFSPTLIEARNELTWPMAFYVKVYLVKPLRLPEFTIPPISAALRPILKGPMNRNKAVVMAVK
jgi:2-polyprenyl-3-methyl-5-hydroxy-6-metoxy-1,4-benzoquinol methylase